VSARRRRPSLPPVPQDSKDEGGIQRLRRDLERVQHEREKLRRENVRLRRENERLKKQLDAARRAGFRQAAPFSRGEPKRDPRRPGRKPGRAYGRRGKRPTPKEVDEIYEAPLPDACPDCGEDVRKESVVAQYQEDIPPVRPIVRQFNVHIGSCRGCHRRLQGRHPLQTSDALGAAAIQIGPQAVAFAAFLNKQLGLSFGKIVTLMQERFGLRVSRGGLVRALHRVADRARPSYEALCDQIRGSPTVTPDETGWKVAAVLWWLHVFVTRDTTVYSIAPGRGYEEAAAILGEDFAGKLTRDGWAPYRKFLAADHQTCLGHLLNRCEELLADHPRAPLPARVKEVLQKALQLRDRRDIGEISPHGLAVARGRLAEELVSVVEQSSTVPDVERFANHLAREFTAIFTFLFHPEVDATNWRAEQAIRGSVITRKVCGGGNRTERGAETQQVLASILRTAAQRGLNASDLLVTMLRTAEPIVPPGLGPTTS